MQLKKILRKRNPQVKNTQFYAIAIWRYKGIKVGLKYTYIKN